MAQPMRLHKILGLGILFFVFLRQGSFAQCGQTTQQFAVSTPPKALPTPETAKRDSEDRTVVLKLEMTDKSSVRDVEVFGNPGKLRTAAILAAVKFANGRKHLDRLTWPFISVVVTFPQNGHGAPRVGQVVVGGVPGCVYVIGKVRVSSEVMGCYLVDRVEPVYPAGTENMKDPLTLAVVVGKDGNVLNVKKISGPENLGPAAVEAIRKWRYRPYLINGDPIEVHTTVGLPAGATTCIDAQRPTGVSSNDNEHVSFAGAPPSWLFNTRPVIPILATEK